jgi:diacylglycerol kinase (ATP)
MINFVVNRVKSFGLAAKGIVTMLKSEHNAWLHMVATVFVCGAGFYLGLDNHDWCWIVLAIVAVWMAEALNTALECLADVASPDFHPLVEKAKDVAAGAVLIASIGSVVIAFLVFGPYISALI